MPKLTTEIGERFGAWVVEDHVPEVFARASSFCRCICGKTAEVPNAQLRRGASLSCGCVPGNELTAILVAYERLYGKPQNLVHVRHAQSVACVHPGAPKPHNYRLEHYLEYTSITMHKVAVPGVGIHFFGYCSKCDTGYWTDRPAP